MKKTLFTTMLLFLLFIPGAIAWGENAPSALSPERFTNAYDPSYRDRATQAEPTQYVKVPILIYHAIRPYRPTDTDRVKTYVVEPEAFEAQLQYLQTNGYTSISPDDLELIFAGQKELPAKPVIITFDDGWRNQFTYGYPLLKKYGDTATFYVYSNVIGNKSFLTWKQLIEMDQNGMTIGGHTRTHPVLYKIMDPLVLQEEIAGGKAEIEKHLGKPVEDFAYPYGVYNRALIQSVKEAGYLTARSTYEGAYQAANSLFTLKGYIVPDQEDKFTDIMNKLPGKHPTAVIQAKKP